MTIKQPTYFSQRNGYRIPSEQLALETVPDEVRNAIVSAFLRLLSRLGGRWEIAYEKKSSDVLCEYLWTHFFHKNISDLYSDAFKNPSEWVLSRLQSSKTQWFTQLDFIEAVIAYSKALEVPQFYIKQFESEVNTQFESLSYGYRIIKDCIIEITSKAEKDAVEQAVNDSQKPVKDTLLQALSAHCARPEGDYAGSIKHSISAVEIECCRLTKESTLGAALKKLKGKGIAIHPQLEAAFQNLYNYSNNEQTGIRHGKRVPEDTFVPEAKESLFMIVACSAFINYLHSCELEGDKSSSR